MSALPLLATVEADMLEFRFGPIPNVRDRDRAS